MGRSSGAALGNIGAYQGYAAVSDPHGSLLSWTTIEKGGIIVNGAGHRFGDESAGYSGYTPNVMAQGGPCFAIFDQRIFDIAAAEEEFVELANYGGVKQAGTPQALAALHRLDAVAVAAALDDYNKAARGAQPDPFGRRDFALAPLAVPIYVCRLLPALFPTQGGLMVDTRRCAPERCRSPNRLPVRARGRALGPARRLSGSLLSAVGLGRLVISRRRARSARRPRDTARRGS